MGYGVWGMGYRVYGYEHRTGYELRTGHEHLAGWALRAIPPRS